MPRDELPPPALRALRAFALGERDRPPETTPLTPSEEVAFQRWAVDHGITDVDHPESYYDYRGYWKDIAARGRDRTQAYDDGLHFPDTYKQHGHPTFSIESKYSAGPMDGGRWNGEQFVPAGADLVQPTREERPSDFLVAHAPGTRPLSALARPRR